MKVLKFREQLVPLIMSGEKDSTWRLFDDKSLSVGDAIELQVFVTLHPFARAHITKITQKPFKSLTAKDCSGHEKYRSDAEMYQTYSTYYKAPVGPETQVKIVWFSLDGPSH